jgi:tripartite-type tricarboxylate transporter receptor subunit TctC
MKRLFVLAMVFGVSCLVIAGGPAVPATGAAAEVSFPAGKPITFIVPWAAGSSADVGARLLAAALEKELGVPVQVSNRPGGGSQTGMTQLVTSKPDGYTIGLTELPSTITTYLIPERKAIYGRKDFQQVAHVSVEPMLEAVRADSPIKSIKDIVDAAKAKPGQFKIGTPGLISIGHVLHLMWAKKAGIEFALVHFDGSGPAMAALLGGHVQAIAVGSALMVPQYKSGAVRVLAVVEQEESKVFPGVKTLEAHGYNVHAPVSGGISVPAGTPREIVDILSAATKRVVESADFKSKMGDLSRTTRYMNPDQYAVYWDQVEKERKPIIDELLKTR